MKMPFNFDLEKYLKNMAHRPLTKSEKETLWAKIETKINHLPREKIVLRRFPFLDFLKRGLFTNINRRFAYAVVSLLIFLGISTTGIAAAYNSKPGDFLFPLGFAVEKVQVAFASGKNKDDLEIKFAIKRLNDAKYVLNIAGQTATSTATSTNPVSSATTSPAVYAYKNIKNLRKAEYALTFALEQLQKTRSNFEKEGNTAAMATIDKIIEELKALTENHLADLDKLQVDIASNNRRIKAEVKNYKDELKIKFKFENKKGENKNDGDKNNKDDGDNNNKDDDGENSKKITICHITPGNPTGRHTITVSKSALSAHKAHGDTVGRCDTSQTDTAPPIISNIIVNRATTTATIIWRTNESANSKIWYGTSSPLVISPGTLSVGSNNSVINHSLSLTGLSASTTYYFVAVSSDASGNTATSTQSSFTTLSNEIIPPSDTISPVISDVSATSTTSVLTTVSWKTDELSTSKIWYDTITPLVISTSTPSVESSNMTLNHSLALGGLTASSTYYYKVSSSDASANTRTSSEFSFTTLY